MRRSPRATPQGFRPSTSRPIRANFWLARANARCGAHPRNRNAGRLQHDLARAGATSRRALGHARARPEARPGRAGEHRASGPFGVGRDSCRASARFLGCARERGSAAFDFVFIDADKQSIPDYFLWSLKLTHPGSVIVVDNVIRKGAVLDATSSDAERSGRSTLQRNRFADTFRQRHDGADRRQQGL